MTPASRNVLLEAAAFGLSWSAGRNETLVAALSTGIPGAFLIATAWSLRILLVEERSVKA